MRKQILLIFFVAASLFGSAQITGKVITVSSDAKKEPLPGANIYWQGTQTGTSSDESGEFSINKVESTSLLIVTYVGFKSDTVNVKKVKPPIEIVLLNGEQLKTFKVEYRKKSSEISLINPLNITTVGEQELRKAACCNLSESFETNASIDASFTDAVTGTRQIKMLGLSGKYTQVLSDNIPSIRGLSTIYGLTYIPGPWIGSIQISKGVGSVVNGFESITGQINVDVKGPFDSEKLHLNLFVNGGGRVEVNGLYQQKLGARWRSNLLVHAKTLKFQADRNSDGFMDNPLENDYAIYNNWRFIGTGGLRSEIGIGAVGQDHEAGQISESGTVPAYKVIIKNNRVEAFAKLGYVGAGSFSLGFQNFGSIQETNSNFGNTKYKGYQTSWYSNFILQTGVLNDDLLLKAGVSIMIDDYNESINYSQVSSLETQIERLEVVPGIFTEATINKGNWSAIAGLRIDYHNLFGSFITPRLHARYSLNENTSLKISSGRGQRTPNVITENIGLLATNRSWNNAVLAPGELLPEIAWNNGINLTNKFRLNYRDGEVSVDFYRTDFINQVIVDLDQSAQEVWIYNLNGKSFSNSFQVEGGYEIVKRTQLRLAYRWLEVKKQFEHGLDLAPLVASHRGFINLGHETKKTKEFKQWKTDLTVNIIGESRLPKTVSSPVEYQLESNSPAFITANFQATRVFGKRFEVYVGSENITNFKQSSPIVSADNPNSSFFDSSMVWGPIFGRMFYGGLRYVIE